ncbi:Proton channel OTOP1 [Halotydeus destructor]|nr:Proton channel OTOP1 [Halotydeus destructor]
MTNAENSAKVNCVNPVMESTDSVPQRTTSADNEQHESSDQLSSLTCSSNSANSSTAPIVSAANAAPSNIVQPLYHRMCNSDQRIRAASVGSLYAGLRGGSAHQPHPVLTREASSISMYKQVYNLDGRPSLASMASASFSCSSFFGPESERHLHRCVHVPKNPKTQSFIVASSIYGQLLVVLCLAFFTAEISTKIPLIYFECFFLYLYAVSLIFLFYVYVYLLHDLPTEFRNKDGSMKKKLKTSETERSHGSIFLRIGAIGFGLGTMIYNGLEFGSYFEIPYTSPCYSVLLGVNPVLHATFTFAQMYFIFTYSRLMINKFKLLARLGLMHLVGTNICIWIRTLGKETLQELQHTKSHALLEELVLPSARNRTLGGPQ